MELFTNPWFIVFTGINIAVMIFLAIKFYRKNKKDDRLLFDRLKDAEINISIKKPIHSSDLNEEKTAK
ncbi:MAG: hypothetical protein ABIJ59_16545 [Pseudomonadota bacterium]